MMVQKAVAAATSRGLNTDIWFEGAMHQKRGGALAVRHESEA
jgi:hypothetical protein